jgi:hypothetical protein
MDADLEDVGNDKRFIQRVVPVLGSAGAVSTVLTVCGKPSKRLLPSHRQVTPR